MIARWKRNLTTKSCAPLKKKKKKCSSQITTVQTDSTRTQSCYSVHKQNNLSHSWCQNLNLSCTSSSVFRTDGLTCVTPGNMPSLEVLHLWNSAASTVSTKFSNRCLCWTLLQDPPLNFNLSVRITLMQSSALWKSVEPLIKSWWACRMKQQCLLPWRLLQQSVEQRTRQKMSYR